MKKNNEKSTDIDIDKLRESFIWLGKRIPQIVETRKKLSTKQIKTMSAGFKTSAAEKNVTLLPQNLTRELGYATASWTQKPREDQLPFVVATPHFGYLIAYDIDSKGNWLVETDQKREVVEEWPSDCLFLPIRTKQTDRITASANEDITHVIQSQRSWIYFFVIASIVMSILMLATSLFSMQVYDRVMSTGGIPTLVVLATGVVAAILVELMLKSARASLVEHMTKNVDIMCARRVFHRLLKVRLDSFPQSVGTLAAQVKGFELVRNYRIQRTTYLLSDIPIAITFTVVIFILAGTQVALIPAIACILAIFSGISFKKAIEKHTQNENNIGNKRHGKLVEVIRNIETIKSTGASWLFDASWHQISAKTTEETLSTKSLSENSSFISGTIQQISYVALVSTGAFLSVSGSDITIGSIIACSILSGRILTPINMLPNLIVQSAHAKIALKNLEALYSLATENEGVETPVSPDVVNGTIKIDHIEFSYPGQTGRLSIDQLDIHAGEKVGIVGAIGCGKSTILKLMSGLCAPSHGKILLGGINIQQVEPHRRTELISYLPQQTRLFGGTLRENLTLGLQHIEDSNLIEIARKTGLLQIISSRQEGLDLPIHEGGSGVSGGQAQLIAATRVLLSDAKVWLLDEPTSSMDDIFERACIQAFSQAMTPDRTLVLVTHKPALLNLVDRLIVMTSDGQIALDGPKAAVIEELQRRNEAAAYEKQAPDQRPTENRDIQHAI
jgi:ATP-binding cassette subfamily C protein LapB